MGISPCPSLGLHYLLMYFVCLAQSAPPSPPPPGPETLLFSLLLIGALLGIGLLVLVGLVAAWRNYIQRQHELEIEHEERTADLPRPDAWSTAAQRIDAPDADPDEAHIPPGTSPEDSFAGEIDPDAQDFDPDDENDDEDDFPFDLNNDEDDDDDGPLGSA